MKDSTQFAVIAVGLGVLALVLYKAVPKVGAAVAAAGNAVSPLNHDNVFSTAANSVGAAVSGDTSFSLGSWLYGLTHDDPNVMSPTLIADKYNKPPTSSSADPYDVHIFRQDADLNQLRESDVNPFQASTYVFGA